MHALFPQLLSIGKRLRHEDFLQTVLERADKMAQLLKRCLHQPLWAALQEVGTSMLSQRGIGLLGEDVVAEVASRACASLAEWPGQWVFELAQSHLHVFVSAVTECLIASALAMEDDGVRSSGLDSGALVALWPAVAAALLLPISEKVASLEVRFPTERQHDQPWQAVWMPLCLPLPSPLTMERLRLSGVRATLLRHMLFLQQSMDVALTNQESLEERLQVLAHFSTVIAQFGGAAESPDLLKILACTCSFSAQYMRSHVPFRTCRSVFFPRMPQMRSGRPSQATCCRLSRAGQQQSSKPSGST